MNSNKQTMNEISTIYICVSMPMCGKRTYLFISWIMIISQINHYEIVYQQYIRFVYFRKSKLTRFAFRFQLTKMQKNVSRPRGNICLTMSKMAEWLRATLPVFFCFSFFRSSKYKFSEDKFPMVYTVDTYFTITCQKATKFAGLLSANPKISKFKSNGGKSIK